MQRLTQIPLDCCQGKQINFLSIQLSVKKTDPTLLPAHISTAVFFFFFPFSNFAKRDTAGQKSSGNDIWEN